MRRLPTRLSGPALIEPTIYGDERGFFHETFRRELQGALGMDEDLEFVQDNHSRSARGVIRGLHFQLGDDLTKLVRCARGSIYDVVVDLRRGSPTFGQWEGFELDDVKLRQVYVPVGFAHGFCTVSEVADVIYKQTAYYDPALERGVAYDDPDIGIAWPLASGELVASARDAAAPRLGEIAGELPFVYLPESRHGPSPSG
jgi:dTDP-4-dehydrorhamnose 3,5-epimerase